MLTTFKLTDGSTVTGNSKDIMVMWTQDPLSNEDWKTIGDAVNKGIVVINAAHIVAIRKPTDTEIDHYNVFGTR